MKETKRERFVRLAEARTNKILDMLHLLGNLSNTGAYEYSKKDVDQMLKAIEDGISDVRSRFNRNEDNSKQKFSFKG